MYIKFSPNQYVLRYRRGKLVAKGAGLSFFFWAHNTSACALPVSGTDIDFMFEETTQDFQTVTVQGQLTSRITDYEKAAAALDFTVHLRNGAYVDQPMEKLSKRMVNLTHVLVKSHIGAMGLTEAIQSSRALADQVLAELEHSDECAAMGVSVTGFSILKIRANPETARALEAKTREEILRESDDAIYVRRNASIEQERKVKENELNTQICVEEKKKAIKETELQTKRLELEGEGELQKIEVRSATEQEQMRLDAAIALERKCQELTDLRLANAKKDADAEAYRIRVIMEAYNELSADVLVALATMSMEPEKIIAQAFHQLAANPGKIGTLNITPDLLESLKGRQIV
jgi:hypothetical protein